MIDNFTIKQKGCRVNALGVFLILSFLSVLSGCYSIKALKEQEPHLAYEVEGDYRELAECTINLLDNEPTFRSSRMRERRRPPRSIEVFEDWGNLFEGVMASVIFYEKEPNRTLIEFRGRNNILNYGDSLAQRLEEKFVKPCLRGTEE